MPDQRVPVLRSPLVCSPQPRNGSSGHAQKPEERNGGYARWRAAHGDHEKQRCEKHASKQGTHLSLSEGPHKNSRIHGVWAEFSCGHMNKGMENVGATKKTRQINVQVLTKHFVHFHPCDLQELEVEPLGHSPWLRQNCAISTIHIPQSALEPLVAVVTGSEEQRKITTRICAGVRAQGGRAHSVSKDLPSWHPFTRFLTHINTDTKTVATNSGNKRTSWTGGGAERRHPLAEGVDQRVTEGWLQRVNHLTRLLQRGERGGVTTAVRRCKRYTNKQVLTRAARKDNHESQGHVSQEKIYPKAADWSSIQRSKQK